MADTIWTDDDIATLKAAIVSGVLSVEYAGPPARKQTYQSLAEMRLLLAQIRSEVNASNGGATYRLASTRKGLGA